MATQEVILQKVSKILVQALDVEEDDITPASKLQSDLGAESIDFLDILFRLEREFGIRIPGAELFPESIFQDNPDYVQDGRVTTKGLELLRDRLPFADLAQFDKDPWVSSLGDLFTVQLVTRYVQGKLEAVRGSDPVTNTTGPSR
jgi:acyl carrier protein